MAATSTRKLKFVKRAPPIENPIAWDEYGECRVWGTRVHVHFVLNRYTKHGETPEQIVDGFPTVELADAYAIIAYYLHNKEEMDEWIKAEDEAEERAFEEIRRSNPDSAEKMARIRARWEAMQRGEKEPTP